MQTEETVRKNTKTGWCWDCGKDVVQKIVIPTCAKNKRGLASVKHGNDGCCDDDYCQVSSYGELEWNGKTPLSKYCDHWYRCVDCGTLNVEGNGLGRPGKPVRKTSRVSLSDSA